MTVPTVDNFTSASADGTSVVADRPLGVLSGDGLLLISGSDDNSSTAQFSTPTGMADSISEVGSAANDAHLMIWDRIADGTEAATITVSHLSSDDLFAFYVRILDVDSIDIIDVVGSAYTGNSTSHVIGGVTLSDDAMGVYALSTDGADLAPFGQPTGWTEQGEQTTGSGGSDCAGVFGTQGFTGGGATGSATISSSVGDGASGIQVGILGASAGGGQTIVLGQATETDAAQAVSKSKLKAFGQSTEVDTAQAITAAKALAVGQALETDAAQAVSKSKLKGIGQTNETDIAQAMTVVAGSTIVTAGQALETDTAQAVSTAKAKAIGQSAEIDAALAIDSAKATSIGLASETDTAQPLAVAKQRAIGQASETDLAQIIRPAGPIVIPIGLALEVDVALAMTVDAGLEADKLGDPSTSKQRRTTPPRPRQFRADRWNQLFETYDAFLRRQEALVQSAAVAEATVEEAVQAIIEEPTYHNQLLAVRNVILERMEASVDEVDDIDEILYMRLEETVELAREEEIAPLSQDERDILAIVALAISSGHIH